MTKSSLPLRVDLPAFIAKKQGLLALSADVVKVHRETAKSFEVDLAAVFAERSSCWRCSRTITNAKSRWWGVGPDCAASLGLPYEDGSPDEFPNHGTMNIKRLFLPKSLLSESDVLTLKVFAGSNDIDSEPSLECDVWADENYIYLKAPFVNKKFVDELKMVPGRDWDIMQKITRFSASDQSIHQLCEIIVRWKLLIKLDDHCKEMLARYNERLANADAALMSVGVDSIADIKDIQRIDVEQFDWGLKEGISPWQHQAKGILFAASMFGVEVKKKRK